MWLGLLVPLPAGVVTLSFMVFLLVMFWTTTSASLREATKSRNRRGAAHGSTEVLRLPKGNGTGRFTRVATALSVNRKKDACGVLAGRRRHGRCVTAPGGDGVKLT